MTKALANFLAAAKRAPDAPSKTVYAKAFWYAAKKYARSLQPSRRKIPALHEADLRPTESERQLIQEMYDWLRQSTHTR